MVRAPVEFLGREREPCGTLGGGGGGVLFQIVVGLDRGGGGELHDRAGDGINVGFEHPDLAREHRASALLHNLGGEGGVLPQAHIKLPKCLHQAPVPASSSLHRATERPTLQSSQLHCSPSPAGLTRCSALAPERLVET